MVVVKTGEGNSTPQCRVTQSFRGACCALFLRTHEVLPRLPSCRIPACPTMLGTHLDVNIE